MQIDLSPEIEAKLSRLSDETGGNAEQLAIEAIERFVDYDDWLIGEVKKGLDQIDSGQTLSHAQVGTRTEELIARKKRAL